MKLTIAAEDLGLTDEETTVFRIGKHDYRLAPLRFATVKRSFPFLDSFMKLDRKDPMIMFDAVTSILIVVALGISQTRKEAIRFAEETGGEAAATALDARLAKLPLAIPASDDGPAKSAAEVLAERLEEEIFPDEVEAIHDKVFDLIARSGLRLGETAPAEGEAAAGAGTETSTV